VYVCVFVCVCVCVSLCVCVCVKYNFVHTNVFSKTENLLQPAV